MKPLRTMAWLGGWATDLEPWKTELEAVLPQLEHVFLPTARLMKEPALLPDVLEDLPGDALVGAFSGGAVLWAGHGGAGERDCWYLAPALGFCGPGSFWNSRVVRRMRQRLEQDRETVLGEFADLLWKGEEDAALVFRRERWLAAAREWSPAQLDAGLALLEGAREAVVPRRAVGDRVLLQEKDAVVAPELAHSLGIPVVEGGGGHFSFPWNAPGLQRLWSLAQEEP